MKLSFRSTRRSANRKAAKSGNKNPIAVQARIAILLLEKQLLGYMSNQKPVAKALPYEIVTLYQGIIISGAKVGATDLQGIKEIEAHAAIVKEIEIMFGVFVASCKKYCNDYKTENVPKEVINSFFTQVRNIIG